jgi:hypothetical protein
VTREAGNGLVISLFHRFRFDLPGLRATTGSGPNPPGLPFVNVGCATQHEMM